MKTLTLGLSRVQVARVAIEPRNDAGAIMRRESYRPNGQRQSDTEHDCRCDDDCNHDRLRFNEKTRPTGQPPIWQSGNQLNRSRSITMSYEP
jgi:hypothetical protein